MFIKLQFDGPPLFDSPDSTTSSDWPALQKLKFVGHLRSNSTALSLVVMEITINIPDKFVPPSVPDDELSRDLLEAYAIENYRKENLSLGQVAELLGLSIDETHAFLKSHNLNLNYDFEDLARDRRTVEMFLE